MGGQAHIKQFKLLRVLSCSLSHWVPVPIWKMRKTESQRAGMTTLEFLQPVSSRTLVPVFLASGHFHSTRKENITRPGWNVNHLILDETDSSALVCHRPCRSCLCPTPWWSWTHPGPSAWPGLAGFHHFHPGSPADHRWMRLPCAPPLDCQMTRPSGCCFQVLLFLGPRVTRYCISAHLTSPSC